MREFEIGDVIGYHMPKQGDVYGIVVDIDGDELVAEYWDKWAVFRVPADKAVYCEPVYIDGDTAARLARYEMTAGDVVGDIFPPQRIRTKQVYTVSVSDMICALSKASGMPAGQFAYEWLHPIINVLNASFSFGDKDALTQGDAGYRFLPSEGYFVNRALDAVCNCIESAEDEKTDFSDIVEGLRKIEEMLKLPVWQRPYEDRIKANYVRCFDEGSLLDGASDDELALFVRYVDELCDRDNVTALKAKAYGCYGGNRAFPCDWEISRDCLTKLMELDDSPFTANTLGYIYYYGRCSNGEPDYEKAFKYYCVGAAGGVYESRYKLSDMFRNGYGVPKNHKIAASLIDGNGEKLRINRNKMSDVVIKVERKRELPGLISEENRKNDADTKEYNQISNELTSLSSKSEALRERIEQLDKELVYKTLEDLKTELSRLETRRDEIEGEINQANDALKQSESHVSECEGAARTAEEAMKGQTKEDVAKLESQENGLMAKKTQLNDRTTQISTRIGSNEKALEGIKKERAAYEKAFAELTWVTEISDAFNGSLKLETYVQAAYLDRIIDRANNRLETMMNGQYMLERRGSQTDGRREYGLDIDITDMTLGTVRELSSVSGGESFIAALALALGMADEIQSNAGGVSVESLFIDEGFGSLSGDARNNAMKALFELTQGKRLVGIISHVEEIQKMVDKQIVVTKDPVKGSTAKVIV